jgi:hypothetical protein
VQVALFGVHEGWTAIHNILHKAAKSDVLLETISTLIDKYQLFRALALSVPGGIAS